MYQHILPSYSILQALNHLTLDSHGLTGKQHVVAHTCIDRSRQPGEVGQLLGEGGVQRRGRTVAVVCLGLVTVGSFRGARRWMGPARLPGFKGFIGSKVLNGSILPIGGVASVRVIT